MRRLDEFQRLHGPYLLGLARDYLRRSGAPVAEAEEALQDVWVTLLEDGGRRLESIDPERGARPYLAAAVLNAVRMRLRSGGRRAIRESVRPLAASPETPDEAFLRRESARNLESALARLEPEDQLLLRWTYWEGLTYAQAASLAGVKENSLGPLLSRARERLREQLEKTSTEDGGRGI